MAMWFHFFGVFVCLAACAVTAAAESQCAIANAIQLDFSTLPLQRSGFANNTTTFLHSIFPRASRFQAFVFIPEAGGKYTFDTKSPLSVGSVRDTVLLLLDESCKLLHANDDHEDYGFGREAKLVNVTLEEGHTYHVLVGPYESDLRIAPDGSLPVYLTVSTGKGTLAPTQRAPTTYPTARQPVKTHFPTVSIKPTMYPTTTRIDRSACQAFTPDLVPVLPSIVPFTLKAYVGFSVSLVVSFSCSAMLNMKTRAFRFRAPRAGQYDFNTAARLSMSTGSAQTYDTVIQLVSANSCERLMCNDDSERLASGIVFFLAKHQEVIVMVKAYSQDTLDFTLTVREAIPQAPTTQAPAVAWLPSEPECTGAEKLLLDVPGKQTNTLLGRRRKHSCGRTLDKTAVFQFTPPNTGTYVFETGNHTLIELRQRTCAASPLVCGDDLIEAYLPKGVVHYVLVKNLTEIQPYFTLVVGREGGTWQPTRSPSIPPLCALPPMLSLNQPPLLLSSAAVHDKRDLTCGLFLPTTVLRFTAPHAGTFKFETQTNNVVIELRKSCLDHFCPQTDETSCEEVVLACTNDNNHLIAPLGTGEQAFLLVSTANEAFDKVGIAVSEIV